MSDPGDVHDARVAEVAYEMGFEAGAARQLSRDLRIVDAEIDRLGRSLSGKFRSQSATAMEAMAALERLKRKLEEGL